MRLRLLLAAAVYCMLAQLALGHHSRYTAELTGADQFPSNGSAAIGHAVVTIDFDVITMKVASNFSGLEGTVTAAHIHGPTAEAEEGIADVMTQVPTFAGFPSGVTSGDYEQMFDLTNASSYNPAFITASGGVSQAMNALFQALHDGKAYLNIHTTAYEGGEIRGFLFQVPGDYNDNGVVDAADYVLWRGSEGETGEGLQADSNNDNVIDIEDYNEWRSLFGNDRDDGHHHGSGAAVPEPTTLAFTVAIALVLLRRWLVR
jgi:hypothetical protein